MDNLYTLLAAASVKIGSAFHSWPGCMSLYFLNGPAAFVLATFTTEATSCSVICLKMFSAGFGSMWTAYSVLV
jgi:hypothetical protein